jgi:thioester reductase-like protein
MHGVLQHRTEPAGLQRILDNTGKYDIKFPHGAADHIKPVIGNTSKPCFNLSDDICHQLAETLDCLYYCAAIDNFYLPYSVLKNTHVCSTTEIAAFVRTRKIKLLYYLSSYTANLINNHLSDFSVVGWVDGYTQTKSVAKKIIHNLIAQGFPAMNFWLERWGHGWCRGHLQVRAVTLVQTDTG